ncbi:hypothetical protein SAMN06265360_105116 [Haloechinothrix alba]|uniref:Uncharacterized protein n=1 Tax=Haloechinothrix alba TaxID=664784 RepID=A0A238W5B6_9PSEU|nr:hypothetical protein [Haloechinothrix alba]SNR41514.1 hypothetical protein SAMN06265360_105116 [Haloechinothrix alba]
MSGSLEVRQFLMRQDETRSTGSGMGVPSQRSSGADSLRISDDQLKRARRAVAGSAHDAEDCALLLDMLGLRPDEDGVPPVQR